MNQIKLASASLLLMTSCSGIPLFWQTLMNGEPGNATEVGRNSGDTSDHARAELEMQGIRYDGDGFPPAPRDEDLLLLKPGYWYGAEVRFPLFSERFMGRAGPDCIEADVSLLSYRGEPVGRVHIRAVRPQ